MSANMENSAVIPELENSFHSTPKEGQCQRMVKILHSCTHLLAGKDMPKILQARFQQYMN